MAKTHLHALTGTLNHALAPGRDRSTGMYQLPPSNPAALCTEVVQPHCFCSVISGIPIILLYDSWVVCVRIFTWVFCAVGWKKCVKKLLLGTGRGLKINTKWCDERQSAGPTLEHTFLKGSYLQPVPRKIIVVLLVFERSAAYEKLRVKYGFLYFKFDTNWSKTLHRELLGPLRGEGVHWVAALSWHQLLCVQAKTGDQVVSLRGSVLGPVILQHLHQWHGQWDWVHLQ